VSAPDFTVCALFYGDYPHLARRCLTSLEALHNTGQVRLRLGFNTVTGEARELVDRAIPYAEYVVDSPINLMKYSVMSQLFHSKPLETSLVVWFDDDSYLREPADAAAWLDLVRQVIQSADMIGARYRYMRGGRHGLTENQIAWVKSRSWYGGKDFPGNYQLFFAAGGWWTIKTAVLQKYQWPDLDIIHRGGDVMLGELIRQQDLKLVHFNHGVAINADEQGRESKAARRGVDMLPVGASYQGLS
jgi:hypothetical protein